MKKKMTRRLRKKKEKKVIIKFMNQSINPSINQSMELDVGKVRLVVVVLLASTCLFLFFKRN